MKKPKRKKSKPKTHTSLAQHKQQGKTLASPFKAIGNLALQSWTNERLPDVLWAALLSQLKPRERYLGLFRAVSNGAEKFNASTAFLTHSELAKLSAADFDVLVAPVVADEQAKLALAPLLLLDQLPDRHHWSRCLPAPDATNDWNEMAHAILETFSHQSEAATDIRWLKVRFLIIQGRMMFREGMQDLVKEVLAFPTLGDMRKVRPTIRSMEGSLGMLVGGQVSPWCGQFWQECLEKTPCAAVSERGVPSDFPYEAASKRWAEVYGHCAQHFMETTSTTAVDPRHDGTFGLALYGLTLIASVLRPNSQRPAGRIVLRSLVETYLTLAYLVKKDDAALWTAYRSYGGGQAKLAFLKLVDAEEMPRYVDVGALEELANEDVWQEFLDIDLGHWAKKDLRRMSEEALVKPVYDQYYGWPSSFVHAQWGAVRSTVFSLCVNPLHRLHRIPRPPRGDFEDVSWDAVKLGNLLLDLVNEAYPGLSIHFEPLEPTKESPTDV